MTAQETWLIFVGKYMLVSNLLYWPDAETVTAAYMLLLGDAFCYVSEKSLQENPTFKAFGSDNVSYTVNVNWSNLTKE